MSEPEKIVHKVDRDGWPAGPWDKEADRVEWRYRGLPCLIVRGNLGALCGYVGLPPGHSYHGKGYEEIDDVRVHGGLTYADKCGGAICHVPKSGESDDVWWLGFDCAHALDLTPGIHYRTLLGAPVYSRAVNEFLTYCDEAYVRREVEQLADQLLAAS